MARGPFVGLRAVAIATAGTALLQAGGSDSGAISPQTLTISTRQIVDAYTNYAVVSAEISDLGDHEVSDYGFVWASHAGPTIADNHLSLGVRASAGVFRGTLELLEPSSSYYVRSFAESQAGNRFYGNELTFTTLTPNTWVPKSQLVNGPLLGAVSFVVNDRFYVGSGLRQGFTHSFYQYSYVEDTWEEIARFPGWDRANAIAFAIGEYGYVGLGYTCLGEGLCTSTYFDDLWRYDPRSNFWARRAAFPGRARAFATAFVIGENAYVTGGTTVGDNDLWQYDTGTDTWTRRADYPGSCYTRGIAFSIGGKGYVGLGWTEGSCNDLWEYDSGNDAWTKRADLPGEPRYDAVGFSRGDEGVVACGVHQTVFEREQYLTDLWTYQPDSDTWTQAPTTYAGRGRSEMVGAVVKGRMFLGLGADEAGNRF